MKTMNRFLLLSKIFVVLYLIRVGAYRILLNVKEHRLLHEKKFILYRSISTTVSDKSKIKLNNTR